MGMYGYTYLGHYIIGKDREVGSTTSKEVCERDASHELSLGGEFCPHCGGKVISVDVPITTTPQMGDIPESELPEDENGDTEDMYDVLMSPEYASPQGYTVMISNQIDGGIELDDQSSEGITEINDALREEQYKVFMEKHKHHIELLRKYVYDDVEVKYGLFRYYM